MNTAWLYILVPDAGATCVVAAVHVSVVITHSIQVVEVVVWISPQSVRPSPRGPV